VRRTPGTPQGPFLFHAGWVDPCLHGGGGAGVRHAGVRHVMRLLVWLGAAILFLFAGLAWYLAPLKPNVLALQLAFTPREFAAIIHAWSPEQLARYRAHLPVDGLLLVCYGMWGYLFAARCPWLAGPGSGNRVVARWSLPIAAALDAVEDALHWWLTEVPRFDLPLPYWISAFSASMKWIMVLAFLVAILYALSRVPED